MGHTRYARLITPANMKLDVIERAITAMLLLTVSLTSRVALKAPLKKGLMATRSHQTTCRNAVAGDQWLQSNRWCRFRRTVLMGLPQSTWHKPDVSLYVTRCKTWLEVTRALSSYLERNLAIGIVAGDMSDVSCMWNQHSTWCDLIPFPSHGVDRSSISLY